MLEISKSYLAKLTGAALVACLIPLGQASAMQFEHVMNIGTQGSGPGQFKYVEDFALSQDGHLLVTDAAHAYVESPQEVMIR